MNLRVYAYKKTWIIFPDKIRTQEEEAFKFSSTVVRSLSTLRDLFEVNHLSDRMDVTYGYSIRI